MRSAPSIDKASGFSLYTCLPTCRAAIVTVSCAPGGVRFTTTSTLSSASRSSTAPAAGISSSPARLQASGASMSASRAIVSPGRSRSPVTYWSSMLPAPTIPTLAGLVLNGARPSYIAEVCVCARARLMCFPGAEPELLPGYAEVPRRGNNSVKLDRPAVLRRAGRHGKAFRYRGTVSGLRLGSVCAVRGAGSHRATRSRCAGGTGANLSAGVTGTF